MLGIIVIYILYMPILMDLEIEGIICVVGGGGRSPISPHIQVNSYVTNMTSDILVTN